jgi:hypothetical protein
MIAKNKNEAVTPEVGPIQDYFNLPLSVNDARKERRGLVDIEW